MSHTNLNVFAQLLEDELHKETWKRLGIDRGSLLKQVASDIEETIERHRVAGHYSDLAVEDCRKILADSQTLVERALEIMLDGHEGQKDKANNPYVMHLIRVAGRSVDEKEMVIALLHDLLEDTTVTLSELEAEFPAEVIDGIVALTRLDGESYKVYLHRVRAASSKVRRVKFRDIKDNMRRDRGYYGPEMEKSRKQYWAGLSILDHRPEGV